MNHNLPPGEYEILQRFGLKLSRREVDLSEIDWDKSSNNHARNIKLNDTHLEDLTYAAKNGALFPDVVLWRFGKKLVIWSGNHRCWSMKAAKRMKIWAVIVESDDEEAIANVPALLNTTSGLPLTRAEKIERAESAIREWKWTPARAAKAFGISESALSRTMVAKEIRHSLTSLGVNTKDLSDFQLSKMKPISGNDHVLAEVGRTATSVNITGEEVGDLVRELKKERSESAMLARAKELRQELVGVTHRSNGHGSVRRSKAVELKMAVTHLFRLIKEVSSVKQFGITKTEEIEKAEAEFRNLASELRRVADRKARSKAGVKKAS